MNRNPALLYKTIVFGVLSMLILLCLSSLSSVGQNVNLSNQIYKKEGNSDYWRVYGCVRDLLGNKLEKVTVWISSYDLTWVTKTDSDGFYEFPKIPKRIPSWMWFSMVFEKKGYLERAKIILGTEHVDEIEINAVLVKNIFDRVIDYPSLDRFQMMERLQSLLL